jgi:mRNA interferase RelE/StbE
MYELVLTRKSQKFYQKANSSLVSRLNKCFEQLCQNPYQHPNIKSLQGKLSGRWRYRVGDWRVVYKIDEEQKLIIILLIATRGEVYR